MVRNNLTFFLFIKNNFCNFVFEIKYNNMEFKKFDSSQKSSFNYWLWHWLAFNYTAKKLGVWKFKYLLHDIEKPWLKLFWGDYTKVRKWHRENNKHHITFKNKAEIDWEAAVIDWEASRLTKNDAPMNARETYEYFITKRYADGTITEEMKNLMEENVPPILQKLGL